MPRTPPESRLARALEDARFDDAAARALARDRATWGSLLVSLAERPRDSDAAALRWSRECVRLERAARRVAEGAAPRAAARACAAAAAWIAEAAVLALDDPAPVRDGLGGPAASAGIEAWLGLADEAALAARGGEQRWALAQAARLWAWEHTLSRVRAHLDGSRPLR